ncbi:MAG: hypothetical protein RBT49_14230 [Bacteroidales bacterium]|jgi:hypothetical protein|nr:hypothetical protein [Bacteroidales bacterium]
MSDINKLITLLEIQISNENYYNQNFDLWVERIWAKTPKKIYQDNLENAIFDLIEIRSDDETDELIILLIKHNYIKTDRTINVLRNVYKYFGKECKINLDTFYKSYFKFTDSFHNSEISFYINFTLTELEMKIVRKYSTGNN